MQILLILLILALFFGIAELFGRSKHIGRWWTFALLTCTPVLPGIIALILSPSAKSQASKPNNTIKVVGIVLLVLAVICIPPFLYNLKFIASEYVSDRMRFRFSLLPLLWFFSLGMYLYKLGQGLVINHNPKVYFKINNTISQSISNLSNHLNTQSSVNHHQHTLYFLVEDGQQSEPYTFDQLKDKRIKENDLVWRNGLEHWVKASELKELSNIIFRLPPPIPSAKVTIEDSHPVIQATPVTPIEASIENPPLETKHVDHQQLNKDSYLLFKIIALLSIPIVILFVVVAIFNDNHSTLSDDPMLTEAVVETPDTNQIETRGSSLSEGTYYINENLETDVCRAYYGGEAPSVDLGFVDDKGDLHVALGQLLYSANLSISASANEKPYLTDEYSYTNGEHYYYSVKANSDEMLLVFKAEINKFSDIGTDVFKAGKLFLTHDGKTEIYDQCLSLPLAPLAYYDNMSLPPNLSSVLFVWKLPKYYAMHIEWQPSPCASDATNPKIHIW